MGGNALKPFETRRVSVEEYEALTTTVLSRLKALFPSAVFWVPKAYHTKPSFGDIDIVAHSLPEGHVPTLLNELRPKAHYLNTNILSFEYDSVQVDLIHIAKAQAHFTYRYFCYNDLGGLLHVLSKRMGFYIGQAGMQYKCYMDAERNQLLDILTVTHDFDAALTFLGLSPERYAQGFETLEDIFKFVASSDYFTPDAFLFENRNAHDRFRDQKRATYMAFLEWLKQHRPPAGKEANRVGDTYQVLRASHAFPQFATALHELVPAQLATEAFMARVLTLIEGLGLPSREGLAQLVVERKFFKYVASQFDTLHAFWHHAHVFSDQELTQVLREYWAQYTLAGFPLVSRVK